MSSTWSERREKPGAYKEHCQLSNNFLFLGFLIMCRPYCLSSFYLIYIFFLISLFLSPSPLPSAPFSAWGDPKTHLLSTTPLQNTYRWLILPSHLPVRPTSPFIFKSLWHLFLSLTAAVPSLANFHCEEMRGLRTFEAEPLCTTCFTCKASGGLQSIIMIPSPGGAEGGEAWELGHGMVWVSDPRPASKWG